jgi:hypothetical protein
VAVGPEQPEIDVLNMPPKPERRESFAKELNLIGRQQVTEPRSENPRSGFRPVHTIAKVSVHENQVDVVECGGRLIRLVV